MERNFQKIGLVNLIIFLLLGIVALVAARYSQSSAGFATSLFMGLGFLISVISWFQMRLEDRERIEEIELEELSRTAAPSATLFKKTEDSESFPARRSREQFEKYLVPIFTILLCIAQGAAAWWLWYGLDRMPAIPPIINPFVGLGTFGLMFLVAFLFGKYAASTARLEKVRLLRPSAGYLLLTAYLSLAVTIGIAVVEAGFPKADYYIARVIAILLGVAAIETLISLIFDLYRPRLKGKVARPLYESRTAGLIGTPEGLVTTAAQALDYQFGFKVSDTWFYRFLERWLGWVILAEVVILLLSTCVVFIEPGEQGLIERFGRAVVNRPVLEPGPHLKLPWPMDKVYRFRTREVQTVNIGFVPDPAREHDPVILWNVPHYKEEYNLIVASRDAETTTTNATSSNVSAPVNLLTLSIPLQFEITDVRAWAYNHEDSAKFLEQIGTREVVRYLASADLTEIMTTQRGVAAVELRKRIQEEANRFQLGINVLFVGLQDIHPPTKVADAFQAVVGAQQEIEARLFRAEGNASTNRWSARGLAATRVAEAKGDAIRRKTDVAARAAQFTNQLIAFKAAPDIYKTRTRMQAFAAGSVNTRIILNGSTNANVVIEYNLEESIAPNLLREASRALAQPPQ
jgi:membrane protease subunit HflK